MSFKIMGIGCETPAYSVDQETAAQFARECCADTPRQERLLGVLYRRTGIRRRASVLLEETSGLPTHDFYHVPKAKDDMGPGTESRMVIYEKYAGRLASRAGRAAMGRAGLSPEAVTHLITVSCTGFYAPGLDFDVIRSLGLPASVQRVQLGFMGCQAVLNALRVALAIAKCDAQARILICAVELCTLHFQYGWDPDRIVSNALFADGAGALIGGAVEEGESAAWSLLGNGAYLMGNSADAMTWRIGDHGFRMSLSARVPDLIENQLREWVDRWLDQFNLKRSRIASWAIHPGGPRILSSARKALDLPEEATRVSHEVLSRHGNMSSATMMFILDALIAQGAPLPAVALGFGPGLTVEAALFE
jgi:predicted naringenin-chalcone synthase